MTTTTTTTRTGALVPGRTTMRRVPAAYAAAGLSLAAALIHLWVVPEHLEEWWVYGAFFLVATLAQLLFSVLVLASRSNRLVPLGSIVGNVVLVLLYVVSRTWGMPLGRDWAPFNPSVAHLEEPDLLAVVSTAAEIGIIVACVALLPGSYRRWTANALLLVGCLVWTARLVGIIP